ncbi:MAG: glycosyl hydrolase family 8, partial [Candidatus Margulisbacteria bacterium]|nr:glycosyl hydrolase family 8 [Candidatus Margulisiibacteriota bacterium]
MGFIKRGIFVSIFIIGLAQASLLYRSSYPAVNYGAKVVAWDTALTNTLAGYKSRFIDAYGTGLVHDTSRTTVDGRIASASVSEGTGYGLLLFLWGNRQDDFDALWSAAVNKQQKSNNKLFKWIVDKNGYEVSFDGSTNNATDADEDIALALIFADRLKKLGFADWKDSSID